MIRLPSREGGEWDGSVVGTAHMLRGQRDLIRPVWIDVEWAVLDTLNGGDDALQPLRHDRLSGTTASADDHSFGRVGVQVGATMTGSCCGRRV